MKMRLFQPFFNQCVWFCATEMQYHPLTWVFVVCKALVYVLKTLPPDPYFFKYLMLPYPCQLPDFVSLSHLQSLQAGQPFVNSHGTRRIKAKSRLVIVYNLTKWGDLHRFPILQTQWRQFFNSISKWKEILMMIMAFLRKMFPSGFWGVVQMLGASTANFL